MASTDFASKNYQSFSKFVDRFPGHPYAGKETKIGKETVADCLTFPMMHNTVPDSVRRLQQWTSTPLEQHRLFHAQVDDPTLDRARSMVHGIPHRPGPGASDLINPVPHSVYEQKFKDRLESIYQSSKEKPLGRNPDPRKGFPDNFNYKDTVFGIKSVFDGSAKECLNPDKSFVTLKTEEINDHDHYLKSHKHFYPGEQAKRGYSANPRFQSTEYFGIPTPCDQGGLLTKACLNWHTEKALQKKTPLVNKRLDDFREKYTHQLGKSRDPIRDTMIVNPDHRFGALSTCDKYRVGDLLQGKVPYFFATGPYRERSVIGSIKNQVRSLHYTHYPDIHEACLVIDKNNSGSILESEARSICKQFNVPVDTSLLEQLFDICHIEKNQVDWRKFVSAFNWQEKAHFEYIQPDDSGVLNADVCTSDERAWTTQNRLQREVERELGGSSWTTTNSMYNGGGILGDGTKFQRLGMPTIRTDLRIPKIRKATDRTSYGDDGGARCAINPSIMTLHGVTEMDLLIPRSKQECRDLYTELFINNSSGKSITPFETIWDRCLEITTPHKLPINIDIFKTVIQQFQNQQIHDKVVKDIPDLIGCSTQMPI